MSHRAIISIFVLIVAATTPAALQVDATCGFALQSDYRYMHDLPIDDSVSYMTFDPVNKIFPASRLTIDIWKDRYRFGVLGGFMRRYDLTMHTSGLSRKIGEILSMPIIGFLEGHAGHLIYEFGLGPFITRFNYTDSYLPSFGVTSLFGFLFGAGYERNILPHLAICAKGELLINAPVLIVDNLDPMLKQTIKHSRYPEYNLNEYPTIIFAATISGGLRYEFGKNIRLPLDDGVSALTLRVLPGLRSIFKSDRQ